VQDVGITSEVVWHIENGALIREETLSSKQPVSIRRWRMAIPSTYNNIDMEMLKRGAVRFKSAKGTLDVTFGADFPVETTVLAAGDDVIGRGVHGAIPLQLVYEAQNVELKSGNPLKSKLILIPQN